MHVKELFSLNGRVAVVTGGSRGLGLEIAHGLGEPAPSVVVTARRQEWLGPGRGGASGRPASQVAAARLRRDGCVPGWTRSPEPPWSGSAGWTFW